jgi:SAM-dependent methyltransferase
LSAPSPDSLDVRPCPVCGRPGGEPLHDVASVPVHSCLVMDSRAEAVSIATGALAVVLCRGCGAMTNRRFGEQDMAYSARYEDSQAFSTTFVDYARGLAGRWVDAWDLRGRTVLEIGAGRGDFSRLLAAAGAGRVLAMDPTVDPHRFGEPDPHVTLVAEAYDAHTDLASVDAVAMRHVLEHVDDPGAILRALRHGLAERPGVPVLVEIPEAGRILAEGAFWDVYHEHCNYLTRDVAVELFESSGFVVRSATLAYGDQYLLVEALPVGRPRPMRLPDPDLDRLVRAAVGFRTAARAQVDSLARTIEEHARTGRVVVWGSGSKGTAFLHALGPTAALVDAVVDVNPHLAGKYVAGTGHPILAPGTLAEDPAGLVVAMNPVYVREIRADLDRLSPGATLVALGADLPAPAGLA